MAMHLDRPIGEWLRQQHNVRSVITVFSALSTMKIAAIAAPATAQGHFQPWRCGRGRWLTPC